MKDKARVVVNSDVVIRDRGCRCGGIVEQSLAASLDSAEASIGVL